jgi:hypothetical protein
VSQTRTGNLKICNLARYHCAITARRRSSSISIYSIIFWRKIGLQHGGAGKIWANHYYGLPSEPSLNRSNFLPGGPHPSMYGYIYYTSTQQERTRHAKRVARAVSGRPPDIARQSRYPPRSICLPRCRGPASIRLSLHRFGRPW